MTDAALPSPASFTADDESFMRAALEEAHAAEAAGEIPIGAVVVLDGKIVGRGRNSPRSSNDPAAHAEVLALREAGRATSNYRLTGAALYVTVEPCLMCVGAAVHARLGRIVFGAADPKAGATWVLGHAWPGQSRLNHSVAAEGGLLETDCASLLKRFFAERR